MTQPDVDAFEISPAEVGRRFLWAKRRGRPAWLWPDVGVEGWREALRGIEAAVRLVLLDKAAPMLDGDPAAVGLACYTSGAGPLLGWWAERGLLRTTAAIEPVLRLHLEHSRRRAARMEASAVAVVGALLERGIEVVVLKGAHTAGRYFPEPGTRPASDIDLLVGEADAESAEQALAALGLAPVSRARRESSWRAADAPSEPRSLIHVHAEDGWSIDLHSSLDVFVSAGSPLARLDAADPMTGNADWAPDPRARVLEQPLLLLHLAVHAGSGPQNLTLLRLIELALVIRRDAPGPMSWTAFLEIGARTGALGYAYPALRLCEALAPGVTPRRVLDECARRAPPRARRIVERLSPAEAQRIDGVSLAEHFMWTRGWSGWLRHLAWDIAPSAGSLKNILAIYENRAWRLRRRVLAR